MQVAQPQLLAQPATQLVIVKLPVMGIANVLIDTMTIILTLKLVQVVIKLVLAVLVRAIVNA